MIDQYLLTEMSRKYLGEGLKVLQGFRMGQTEREHIAALLDLMAPEENTTWVDIGSGFGEPARLMRELRPDLTFHLVNNCLFQNDEARKHFESVWDTDMCGLPFADASHDGAMFLFSLCHADEIYTALREAWRVVRPGGKLFVFDYVRTRGDDYISWQFLSAKFFGLGTLHYMCRFTGWEFDKLIAPKGSDAVFRALFADQELYDRIFDDLTPVVLWATRR